MRQLKCIPLPILQKALLFFSLLCISPASMPEETGDAWNMSLSELMDTIVFSSTKSLKSISSAPSIITVFTDDDIRKLGAETLSDVLFRVPGVQVQVRANNRHGAWFRGVQSEFSQKILLLIDGVPYRNSFGGFPLDEEISLDNVKKIEIIRGPGSALYGANAFSGVINIYTFQPGDNEKYHSANIEIGQNNTRVGSFLFSSKSSYVNIILEGKLLDTDGYTPSFDRRGNKNHRSGKQSLEQIGFKAYLLEDSLVLRLSSRRFSNTRVDKEDFIDNDRELDRIRTSMEYKKDWGDDNRLNVSIYRTKSNRLEDEDKFNLSNGFRVDLDESFAFIDNTEIVGVNLNVYSVIKSHELLTGIELQKENLKSSFFVDEITGIKSTFISDSKFDDVTLENYGIFLQDNYKFNNRKTQITLGLRYDFVNPFDDQFNFRSGLTHNFTDRIFTKLLYGTAYRSPSLVEFVRAPPGATLPDVEKMKTLELQAGFKGMGAYYSLTAFHNSFDDLISRRSNNLLGGSVSPNNEIFDNLDDQTMYGLEFESRFHITRYLSGFVNASWMNTESKTTQEEIPLLASWTVSAGIDWSKDVGIGRLLFHNDMVIFGGRNELPDEVWVQGQEQRYPGREDDFVDGFAIWNMGLHYKIERQTNNEIDLSLTIKNVTNKVYYTQSSSVQNPNREAFWDPQYDQRHIRLSLKFSWL